MLKQLSRFKGTSKVLIWGFIAVLAAGLVLFFKPSGSGSSTLDPTKSTEVLASVGGDDITVGDFVKQKQSSAASAVKSACSKWAIPMNGF